MANMQSADRFAMLESRMLSSNGPALEFSIGFRPPSNPPSNSAMDASLRSPSPSLAAAVHTGDGLASPSGGGAPKRKQSPQDVEGPGVLVGPGLLHRAYVFYLLFELLANFCQTLRGSVSAVSKPNFAK